MHVLIADDSAAFRVLMRGLLERRGHRVQEAADGMEAWSVYDRDAPEIVLSDWSMPGMSGPDFCRRLRSAEAERVVRGLGARTLYFILLTAREGKESYLEGMAAGADDFLTKPVEADILEARLRVAQRMLGLHAEVRRLAGLLPLCSYCHRIREEAPAAGADPTWTTLERYVLQNSEASFSHGVCPDCYVTHVRPQIDALRKRPPDSV